MSDLSVGSTIGAYAVIEVLDPTCLGPSLLARHLARGYRAVLRIVEIEPGCTSAVSSEAFRAAARMVATFNHAGLVDVLEIWPQDGWLVIAEEALEAVTLDKVLAREGRLSWQRARPILAQVLSAVDFLHQRDFLHLGVSLDSVHVLDQRGSIKLADGGLAQLLSSVAPGRYSHLASGPYWPPEVAAGAAPSPATDVFAMGVLLRAMLTGVVPRHAEEGERFDLLEIGGAAQMEAAPTMHLENVPGLPEQVREAVEACLHADPAQRPMTLRAARVRFGLLPASPPPQAGMELLATLAANQMGNVGYARDPIQGGTICPACRRPLKPQSLSCIACGYVLASRPQPPSVMPEEERASLLEMSEAATDAPRAQPASEAEPKVRTGLVRVDFFVDQGDYLAGQGRWEEAVTSYANAAGDEPCSAVAHNRLGDAFAVLRKYREARAAYERALALNPGDWDARHDLGRVLLTLNDLSGAVTQFSAVAAADTLPELRLSARTHLGSVQSRAGRLGDAIASWRRVIAEGPPNPPVLYAMGVAYARLGDRASAEDCWRQALAIDPNHAESRVALSQSSSRYGGDYHQLQQTLEESGRGSGPASGLLDVLGTILLPPRRRTWW